LLIVTTLMLQPRTGIRGKSSAAQITSCLKYMTSQGDTPLLIDCYNEMVGYRWAIFFHFTLCKTFICRYFVPGTIARAASVVHWSVGFSSLLLSPAGYTCWHSSVPCWPTGRLTVYMQLEQKKKGLKNVERFCNSTFSSRLAQRLPVCLIANEQFSFVSKYLK